MITEPSRPAATATPLTAIHQTSSKLNAASVTLPHPSGEPNTEALALAADDVEWRTNFAWKIFDQNQELIRSTDQKTYNLIVMSTLLISLSSANVERFVLRPEARELALGILVLTCVNFFIHALATLLARSDKAGGGIHKSLIYFAHIAEHDSTQQYRENFGLASKEGLLDDLLTQVSALSIILDKKLRSYRRSWHAAAFEVGAFLLMVLLGHFV